MILNNAIPRLEQAIEIATETKKEQQVRFLYNELLTHDTISSVFNYIFKKGIDFETRHEEYRFVVIIKPKTH